MTKAVNYRIAKFEDLDVKSKIPLEKLNMMPKGMGSKIVGPQSKGNKKPSSTSPGPQRIQKTRQQAGRAQ